MTAHLRIAARFVSVLSAPLVFAPLCLPAQQATAAAHPPSGGIRLNVVVDAKSGQPVTDLGQQNFTILDNKSPGRISSFKVMTAADTHVELILFIDAVNTPREIMKYVLNSTETFLKQNGGKLAHPTIVAVFTDTGIQTDNSFSTDGNSLSDTLEHRNISLRQLPRNGGGIDSDLVSMSLRALNQFVAYASALPGRKLIVFISPGWPLLSGPGVNLTSKQQQQVFGNVVFFSSQLRQAGITLYDVNPLGATEPIDAADDYKNYIRDLAKLADRHLAILGRIADIRGFRTHDVPKLALEGRDR